MKNMFLVAWRGLINNRWRMMIAVFGVTFSVLLMMVELGLLTGMAKNASLLIDRSRADIWVCAENVQTFDFTRTIPARKKHLVASVPGVALVEELNVSMSLWKMADGGTTNCQVVGIDPDGRLGPQLEWSAGDEAALGLPDSVVIDQSAGRKLGYPRLGESVEIIQSRARVMAFTQNMRSFSTIPFVFTSLRGAGKYGFQSIIQKMEGRETSVYLLVKVAPGYEIEQVRAAIARRVSGIEALTAKAFSWRTRNYWLFKTGIGLGLLGAAAMGLMVGSVIVSQTLFALTMERLPEFAVLKALGSSMFELSSIVLSQAWIYAILGLAIGLGLSFHVSNLAARNGTTVEMSWSLVVMVALITLGLCSVAALGSIMRLRRVEPATVFKA